MRRKTYVHRCFFCLRVLVEIMKLVNTGFKCCYIYCPLGVIVHFLLLFRFLVYGNIIWFLAIFILDVCHVAIH
uniref:Putative ovule protein n=1 Tax=Solanum chacoense TaxID=4108 RepID=A0A0V0IJQ7_SOLCH